MKYTEWFPPEIKPVHIGYYQRDYMKDGNPKSVYALPDYWDGKKWFVGSPTEKFNAFLSLSWRGLAEKPK